MYSSSCEDLLLFSGSSHPKIADEIAQYLGVSLGEVSNERFPDGEISLQIGENVRGRDVFVVQSIVLDPNNALMELLVMVDSLKRASAKSIGVIIPYFGYCRQDRKDRPRVPITAKLVANLLEAAGVDRVVTMDLHTEQIQGFFDIPLDNLHALPILASAIEKEVGTEDLVIVAPDIGSVKLARSFAGQLNVDFAVVDKQRTDATHLKSPALIGDVKGKNVLLADDMSSTAETLLSAANACQEKGAKKIFAVVTHGLFVGDSVAKIEKSPIERVYMGNTVPYTSRLEGSSKLTTISVSSLFAQAVHCILARESISSLYRLKHGKEPHLSQG